MAGSPCYNRENTTVIADFSTNSGAVPGTIANLNLPGLIVIIVDIGSVFFFKKVLVLTIV